jgi:hypothetical protein
MYGTVTMELPRITNVWQLKNKIKDNYKNKEIKC